MEKALSYAENYINISEQDRKIIFGTKNAVLINEENIWRKRSDSTFTITMGSYDGAVCCELVGLYLLSILNDKLPGNFGLYRDDGLCAIRATLREIENVKKQLCIISTRIKDYNRSECENS